MHTTRVASGGRYPVLRAVAILFMVGAVGIMIGGVYAAILAFQLPDSTWGRITWAMLALAGTFFGVLTAIGCAELIKLFIDVEHNTRMAAEHGVSVGIGSPVNPTTDTVVVVGTDGKGTGGRVGQWLEGEETAEGALLRGH